MSNAIGIMVADAVDGIYDSALALDLGSVDASLMQSDEKSNSQPSTAESSSMPPIVDKQEVKLDLGAKSQTGLPLLNDKLQTSLPAASQKQTAIAPKLISASSGASNATGKQADRIDAGVERKIVDSVASFE